MNLSFAGAKQPYLEADRPIGKSLSRGKGFRDRVAWIKIMTGAYGGSPLNDKYLQLTKLRFL